MQVGAEYYEHTTIEGDRWDLIAAQYYGDSYRYEEIIVANPDIPIVPILPSGLKVRVPVIEDQDDTMTTEDLPPWKQ